jgi:mRNA interferase MazF
MVSVRLSGDKARPAVVLRSDALARLPYATVVAFTTTSRAEPDLRLPVESAPENGLQQLSFAMVDWPQTIRAEQMGEIIGHLDPMTLEAITGRVAVVLGIGEPRAAAIADQSRGRSRITSRPVRARGLANRRLWPILLTTGPKSKRDPR